MFFDLRNFGMRVQEARMRKSLTQMALAAILDVNPQYISRIERGVNACSLEFLSALAHTLDVSTDYLLTGKQTDLDTVRKQLTLVLKQLSSVVENM